MTTQPERGRSERYGGDDTAMQYVNAIIAVVLLGLALERARRPRAGRHVHPRRHARGDRIQTLVEPTHREGARHSRRWPAVLAFRAVLVPRAASEPPIGTGGGDGIRAAGLLFAGFAMIPVLSEYSCRMKASSECERGRRQFEERKPLLDSVRRSQGTHPASPVLNPPPRI